MASSYSYTFTTPGEYTYVLPYKPKIISAKVWGGGGNGGDATKTSARSGGGGGGAFAEATSATLSSYDIKCWRWTLRIVVGKSSENSLISICAPEWDPKEEIVLAEAGAGGWVESDSIDGGKGGNVITGTGYTGGNGGDGTASYSGGGGGGAGDSANGGAASNQTAGTGGIVDGGDGGAGIGTPGDGSPGAAAGGGGSGAFRNSIGSYIGGAGGPGQAYIAVDFPFNEVLMTFWDTVAGSGVTNSVTITKISSASSHSFAIGPSTYSWGNNSLAGVLGDNSTTNKCSPVHVCGNHTFCQISAAIRNNAAIDNTGQAWTWGSNAFGQLGDNSITDRLTPVAVCGNHTFCQISAGSDYTLAIDNNGLPWAWGTNSYGQLGDNSTVSKRTPVSVCIPNNIYTIIEAGSDSSYIINIDGAIFSWGLNHHGQLGDNSTTNRCSPVSLYGDLKYCKISTTFWVVSAIDNSGQGWSWGHSAYGQLGNNSISPDKCTPVQICGSHTFCEISSGTYHTLGIDNTGQGWSWGINSAGCLGINKASTCVASKLTPVAVCGNNNFCQISAAAESSFALDSTNNVWAWGRNINGELGLNSSTTAFESPVEITTFPST